MTVLGLDHVAVAVRDLDASVKWYCEALGFIQLERRHTRGLRSSMESAVLQAGAALIVLVQGCDPESQVSQFIGSAQACST